ncbi:MAG: hypothetical protein ACRDTT_10930, partial [Pseudonocardiaceae bacterium]
GAHLAQRDLTSHPGTSCFDRPTMIPPVVDGMRRPWAYQAAWQLSQLDMYGRVGMSPRWPQEGCSMGLKDHALVLALSAKRGPGSDLELQLLQVT